MSRVLDLSELRRVNAARAIMWNGATPWTPADRLTELVGELGEAANMAKKLKRAECGMVGNCDNTTKLLETALAKELADTLICLDLWAWALGVDMSEVTIAKFNETSDKNGFGHKLKGQAVRRLTAKEERDLINPIMFEYSISAAPFLELIDKVQDACGIPKGEEPSA